MSETSTPSDAWTPIWKIPAGRLNAGASMLGGEEIREAMAVIRSQSLSRDYGPDCQETVLRFETGFAEKIGATYALATISGATNFSR